MSVSISSDELDVVLEALEVYEQQAMFVGGHGLPSEDRDGKAEFRAMAERAAELRERLAGLQAPAAAPIRKSG